MNDGHTVSTPSSTAPAPRPGITLAAHAAARPDAKAIVSPHGDRTFAELNAHANQLARALRRRGLVAGDGVSLLCSNRAEFAEVWAACMRGGFRITPINFHFTAAEAAHILSDSDARAFIAEARYADAAEAAAEMGGVDVCLSVAGDMTGFENYDAALAAEDPTDLTDPELGSIMFYTSGTTGQPKGVRKRPDAPLSTTVTAATNSGYEAGSVHLCTGPLYHSAPFAVSMTVPLNAGATVVMMPKWDAEEALRLIDTHRVTHTHMVPTMFHRLLALPDEIKNSYDISSLRSVFHGAAPCPVPVKQAMIEWLGPIITEYFAATEGGGTLVDSETWLQHPGTVGRPDPADRAIIGDEDGNPLPPNQVGQVWFKAPAESKFEYYHDSDKTRTSYRGDYFTLGDMAYADEEGYFYVTDRSANLIISGGVNIYPAEVDAVLLEHPAVADAATIGIPNDEWGEEVKAVVELRDGLPAPAGMETELIAFCRERLAHYKCPKTVDFVDTLPRQDNGKIYKLVLREHYRNTGVGRDADQP